MIIALSALTGFLIIFFSLTYIRMDDVALARGIIRAILCIGTITIAFILVAARWVTIEPSAEAKERFTQSKEIFSLLLGILGTVIGWYFGQQGAAGSALVKPAVAAAVTSTETVPAGGNFALAAQIQGGVPPYRITIESSPPELFDPLEINSPSHMIRQTVSIHKNAPTSSLSRIKLRATDSMQNASVEFEVPGPQVTSQIEYAPPDIPAPVPVR